MTAKLGFRAFAYQPEFRMFFEHQTTEMIRSNTICSRVVTQTHNIDALRKSAWTGTAGQQTPYNCEVIQAMNFPLPPASEQQAIAAALDGVDASVEVAREQTAGLRFLKSSTADALLTGRVRVSL